MVDPANVKNFVTISALMNGKNIFFSKSAEVLLEILDIEQPLSNAYFFEKLQAMLANLVYINFTKKYKHDMWLIIVL